MTTASTKGLPALLAVMLLTVGAIAGLSYWDQERESAVALEDFARQQSTLAAVLAEGLEAKLRQPEGPAEALRLFPQLPPEEDRVLLSRPGDAGFLASSGEHLLSPSLQQALASNQRWVRLTPEEAQAIGLPRRTALAGLARSASGWGVAAVESAQRERDREYRARNRILLAVTTASALIFSFGGVALRRQRKELELSRELAILETRREREDRLEKLDKAATLGTLAMGIAHEISTPLGVISGRAEQLVPRVSGDERATRAAQAILEQAGRIHEILRAFLSLARGGRPALQQIAPQQVVDGARGLVEHRFQKGQVSLQSELSEPLPDVQGDLLLLEHALVNLLLNACEACGPGGHVAIGVKRQDGMVSIEVTDDGVGISPEIASRATEPFFTTKSTAGGTGLGLAIVNEIITHHGGKLSLSAGPTRGTAARIDIPIAIAIAQGGAHES